MHEVQAEQTDDDLVELHDRHGNNSVPLAVLLMPLQALSTLIDK